MEGTYLIFLRGLQIVPDYWVWSKWVDLLEQRVFFEVKTLVETLSKFHRYSRLLCTSPGEWWSSWREKVREGGGRLQALPFTSCGNTSALLTVAAAVSSTKSGCDIVHFWGSLWRKKMRKWEISAQCPEYKSLPQKSGPKIPQTMSSVDYGGMWDSTTISIDLGLYSLIQCFIISPIVLSLALSFKVGATIFFFLGELRILSFKLSTSKTKNKNFLPQWDLHHVTQFPDSIFPLWT